LLHTGGFTGGAFLRSEQVGPQGGATHDRPDPGSVDGLRFGNMDLFEQIAVTVEEGSVHAGRHRPAVAVSPQ
jgi:hypothetical protein